jgi:hypothetical protein
MFWLALGCFRRSDVSGFDNQGRHEGMQFACQASKPLPFLSLASRLLKTRHLQRRNPSITLSQTPCI